MPVVQIDLDERKSCFLLQGDIYLLMGNRRAFTYMRDYLHPDLSEDSSISIPFTTFDREKVLGNIQRMLERFGLTERRSKLIESELEGYLQEEENFDRFSLRAKDIWNNQVDKHEFGEFTEVLKSNIRGRTLYPLQLLAAYHLAFSQNACNFSVPGAGKTSIVYAAYAYLNTLPISDPKHINKLLIIGPLSCFAPWEDEFEECFQRRPKSKRLSGGVSKEEKLRHLYSSSAETETVELTLISYQGVSTCLEDIEQYLKKTNNRVMIVLDEAHKIKNTEGGVWAESVLKLASYGNSRVVLTGTPAPNGYHDLYNLFKFIWPNKDIIKYKTFHLEDMSRNTFDKRIPKLIDNVCPYFIRITKGDLKLPEPIIHDPILVDMNSIQRKIYKFIEDRYMSHFHEAGMGGGLKDELNKARMIRLMQAATNPALLQRPVNEFCGVEANELFIDDQELLEEISQYRTRETPAKFIEVLRLVRGIIDSGERVVIWANFIKNLDDLQDFLRGQGINSEIICGRTPNEFEEDREIEKPETREAIIREFHRKESPLRVLIANPFAIGESISLHKTCHNAIYLERNFNAATFIQSKDRIHRYGLTQDDKINYYFIVSRASVDETIHTRLQDKEDAMLGVIESRDIPLINLNMDYIEDEEDDIKAMIRDYVRRTSSSQ